MKLKSIAQEKQVEDCLFGQSQEDKDSVNLKVEFTKNHLSDIIEINGSKVFNPTVKGNDIWYWLQAPPAWWKGFITDADKRSHYYPIQYAEITFFNHKP